eukprot:gnl/Trimastix_PCT/2399.p1 GENE.gnl/Trimastix_PCT/2399~~gnl/Trimastix_PCT/2399.p1  ORF type:complete len:490 (-),score=125.45 gnl/Trimastix_PCT/2399:26-1423(-)
MEKTEEKLAESPDHEASSLMNAPQVSSKKQRIDRWRNLISFFICGLVNNFGYVVMLSAAKDLLKGKAPTAVVLLCDILPTLLIKITAPFFMHRIPYWIRIIFCVLCQLASFQLVAWCNSVGLRLIGVVLASIAAGLGEITFLAITSYYHRNTISAWSSGTGGAGLAGSLSYLGLTSWLRLTKQASLMIIGWLPLLIALCFFVLMTKPWRARPDPEAPSESLLKSQDGSSQYSTHHYPSPPDSTMFQHAAINDPSALEAGAEAGAGAGAEVGVGASTQGDGNGDTAPAAIPKRSLTFKQRVIHIKSLLKYMIPLFVVYLAEYLINQAVVSTIWFKNSPFPERDHYVYYQFIYQFGVFLSRSSVNILPIKRIWIPSLLQIVNLIALIIQSQHNYMGYVWIVFVVILWEGLLGGATYVNAFFLLSKEVEPGLREYSLGVTSVADSLGITLAGVLGVFIEPALKQAHKK